MGNTRTSTEHRSGYAYAFVLVSGFVFWILLGLPWQHHNESYIWAVHLNHGSFLDCVSSRMVTVQNYRPLGQATAWLTFRLSDGSVAPAQIFNGLVALAAWLVVFRFIPQRRVFALAGFVVGGTLFSAYIYIFHLHGVFYSPVLLFIPALFVVFEEGRGERYAVMAAALALLAALFHPYALLLFIAAATGAILKGWKTLHKPQIVAILAGILVAAGAIFVLVLLPGDQIPASLEQRASGLLTSYHATEVHPVISAVAGLLALLTAVSVKADNRVRWTLLAGSAIGLALLAVLGLPLMFVWITVATLKALLHRRFSLAATILTAAFLPGFAPTGSPTYTIYVCMLCTITVALDWHALENALPEVRPAFGAMLLAAFVGLAFIVRSGANIPVVTKLASPLLAEGERTEQLMAVLEWWRTSPLSAMPIALAQEARNPVDDPSVADRRFRPPTSRRYLQTYIADRYTPPSMDSSGSSRLLIVFGGAEFPGAKVVYEIPGAFAGPARILIENK